MFPMKMLFNHAGIVLASSALLCACNLSSPSTDTQTSSPAAVSLGSSASAKTSPPAMTSPPLSSYLKKDMAYTDARKALLAHDWTPTVNAQCKANVVGDDYEQQCASDPSLCKPCEEMPELDSCGADGICMMRFHRAGRQQSLDVGTMGDIGTWNSSNKDAQIFVTGWTMSPAPSH